MTGILNTLIASGWIGLKVGLQPINVAGAKAAGSPAGVVTSTAASCAGANGSGAYTYQWITNGCTANSPNAAVSTFSEAVNAGTAIVPTAYCLISDGVTTVQTAQINVTLQNTTIVPVQRLYTGSGNILDVAPVGAVNVVIEIASPGGGGEGGFFNTGLRESFGGQGGDSGTYCRSSYAISGGQSLNAFLGTPGAGGAGPNFGAPGAGGTSTVSSGSLAIATMTAPGGNTGQAPTGGNQANVSSNHGTAGGQNVVGQGAPAIAGVQIAGYGAGGNGGLGPGNGQAGGGGAISFYYT